MSELSILWVQIILFGVLIYTLFDISSGNATNKTKWVLMVCSVTILAVSDKVKLLFWVIGVGVMYLIKHFTAKRQDNGRTA
jgi:hypothetical protein